MRNSTEFSTIFNHILRDKGLWD